jgi:hypothetical protein
MSGPFFNFRGQQMSIDTVGRSRSRVQFAAGAASAGVTAAEFRAYRAAHTVAQTLRLEPLLGGLIGAVRCFTRRGSGFPGATPIMGIAVHAPKCRQKNGGANPAEKVGNIVLADSKAPSSPLKEQCCSFIRKLIRRPGNPVLPSSGRRALPARQTTSCCSWRIRRACQRS